MYALVDSLAWYGRDGYGWGGPGPWFGGIVLLVVIGALVAGGVYLARRASRAQPPAASAQPDPTRSAEHLLAERFARGELDEDEYRAKIAVLRETGERR